MASPDFVVEGKKGALQALKGGIMGKTMVVIYREVNASDGFIITALADEQARTPHAKTSDMDTNTLDEIIREVADLVKICDQWWVDYDREADVLYISLARPQGATDSDLTDDDILLSYRDDKLVGITVLHASQRDGLKLRED